MFKMQVWLKKKGGMSDEDFLRYWLETHAPISRDGYEHLTGYTVNLVTGAPRGQEPAYDGLGELTWDSRDDFVADNAVDCPQENCPVFLAGPLLVSELAHFAE